MNKKTLFVGTVILVGVANLGWLLYANRKNPINPISHIQLPNDGYAKENVIESDPLASNLSEPTHSFTPSQQPNEASHDRNFNETIRLIRNKYDDDIFQTKTQIRYIRELKAYLNQQYKGEDLDRKFKDFTRAAFPDLAQEIFAAADKYNRYVQWMEGNKNTLPLYETDDVKSKIWDKRKEIFGDDANDIWAGQLRDQIIEEALFEITRSEELPLEHKVDRYVAAIEQAYGPGAQTVMEMRSKNMLGPFLRLSTVQDDLHHMEPEKRSQSLRMIRKRLGMDEQALDRAEMLDRLRDEKWDTGRKYMQERETIVLENQNNPDVEKLEEQLDALRKKYFGTLADSIKNEEKGGFYRYNRKRIYGRN